MAALTRRLDSVVRFLLLVFLGLLLAITHHAALADLPCPLEWSPNGFGHAPPQHTVTVGVLGPARSQLLIGRVHFEGRWLIGTLVPEQRRLAVAAPALPSKAGLVIRLEFYQILTNPHGCLLRWVNDTDGHVPAHAVPSDGTPPAPVPDFIGRATVEGYLLGGRVDANGLLLPFKDNSVHRKAAYEVLVSVYPKLLVSLTQLQYEPVDFVAVRAATRARLLQGELIRNTVNDVTMSTTVSHSKAIQEEFILTEEAVGWAEVGVVSMPGGVPLWFGTSDLQLEEYHVSETEIRIRRIRQIDITRTVNVNSRTDVQLCSILEFLEDFPLPFTAVGEFRLPGMSAAHTQYVLEEVGGRDVLDTRGDVVVAQIRGSLGGRHVIGTVMENGAPTDRLGACAAYKG